VNTRLTPNFLKSICDWQTGGDFVVSHDSPFGIGNSPPATKVAVSPEIAVRFGSASVRMTPARSIARSVAFTPPPENVKVWAVDSGEPVAENALLVAPPSSVDPTFHEPDRSMPSCLITSRDTSATLTLSIT
jgi:hypothetical protein